MKHMEQVRHTQTHAHAHKDTHLKLVIICPERPPCGVIASSVLSVAQYSWEGHWEGLIANTLPHFLGVKWVNHNGLRVSNVLATERTALASRVEPVGKAVTAEQVPTWLQPDVLVVLSADLAQLEGGTHLAVDLVLFLAHLGRGWGRGRGMVKVCLCVCVCVCVRTRTSMCSSGLADRALLRSGL